MDPGHAQAGRAPLAELIVQTGRNAGVRLGLQRAINLLGSNPSCDVHLSANGVHQQHCVVLLGDAGLHIRDLESESGTLVNGERVSAAELYDGDVLTLGSVSLLVELPSHPEELTSTLRFPPSADTQASRDALRIQVAAVAAQQAFLLEEEWRLHQEQDALKQQKEQLAAHLEQKHRQSLEMAAKLQAARTDLKRQRDEQLQGLVRQAEEQHKTKIELDQSRKKIQAERAWLLKLRRRLKQHCDRRLAAERQQLRKRELAVDDQHRRIEREAEKLQVERDTLARDRLTVNGEVELAKRMMQADRFEVAQERKQWIEERDCQTAELAAKIDLVRQRDAELAVREKALAQAQRILDVDRKIAVKETRGLETRIQNQRRKLKEIGKPVVSKGKLRDADKAIGNEPHEVVASSLRAYQSADGTNAANWEHLADDLADQRLELVEMWQRLALFHQLWEQAQRDVSAQAEELAGRISEEETALAKRQVAVESAEAELRSREQELLDFRQHLEGWAARVRLRETGWESEKDRLLAELRNAGQQSEQQLMAIVQLRQTWAKRRQKELEELHAEYALCEQLRQQSARVRQDCWKRSLSLDEQQRELADKALALEEYRQQIILRAPDSATAELRLERIRKRWQRESEATMQSISAQHRQVRSEGAEVHRRGAELVKVADELFRRDAQLAQERASWEENVLLAESKEHKLQQQLKNSHDRHQRSERHLAHVQNEVERLIRILMNDTTEAGLLPSAAA